VPVLTRLIPSPVVVDIRPGALNDLAGVLADQRICSSSGKLAIAISGGSGAVLRQRLEPSLPTAEWFEVGGGTLDDAIKLADAIKKGRYDAVVGLGGGKIIDCAKFAAARVGAPLVAVATNLSHDGLCSPVATLDNDAGRGSYGVPNPIAVVIDLDVIREAPVRFVRSGIGDALSNISAIADWELAARERGEDIDGLAAAMARQAGEAVLRHPGGVGTTPSCRSSPRVWSSPASPCPCRATPARRPAPATRSTTPSTSSSPSARRATASSAAWERPSRCSCAGRRRSPRTWWRSCAGTVSP
jgi:glycerol-1-phosphate dehydrogenase [NAD(P)+]